MLAQVPKLGVSESGESFFGWTEEPRQRMDSPQMYDSTQHGHGGGGGGGGGGAGVGNGLGGGDMKKPPASSAAPGASLTTLSTSAGGAKQTAALLKQHHLQQQQQAYGAGAGGPHGADLSDLNTPEISLDLQNLIDDSQFGDGLFSDILQNPAVASAAGKHLPHALHTRHLGGGGGGGGGSAYARTTLSYMPQPVHSGAAYQPPPANSDSNSSLGSDVPSIKEEPLEPHEYRRQCGAAAPPVIPGGYIPAYPAAAAFATLAPGGGLHAHHGAPGAPGKGRAQLGPTHPLHTHGGAHSPGGGARKPLKPTDKTSDEYRRRRERNNIAVRKSREKAKVRTRETEEKVKLLVKENERLQKRIELLTEELNVLRSLFSNVGVLPEQLHREINKHLDTFQQLQHQQHPSAHM